MASERNSSIVFQEVRFNEVMLIASNSKQFLMIKMTLSVILRRSRRACPELAEGIWPANDEILRFAQNDSFAVSFENLNIRILNLFRISDFVLRILHRKVPFTLLDDVVVLIF